MASGYLVVCRFTTRPQKHWFEARWSALIARLNKEFGLPLVMLGGPGDRKPLHGSARHRVKERQSTGRTDLAEAAALIRSTAVGRCGYRVNPYGIAFSTTHYCTFRFHLPLSENHTGQCAGVVS